MGGHHCVDTRARGAEIQRAGIAFVTGNSGASSGRGCGHTRGHEARTAIGRRDIGCAVQRIGIRGGIRQQIGQRSIRRSCIGASIRQRSIRSGDRGVRIRA